MFAKSFASIPVFYELTECLQVGELQYTKLGQIQISFFFMRDTGVGYSKTKEMRHKINSNGIPLFNWESLENETVSPVALEYNIRSVSQVVGFISIRQDVTHDD